MSNKLCHDIKLFPPNRLNAERLYTLRLSPDIGHRHPSPVGRAQHTRRPSAAMLCTPRSPGAGHALHTQVTRCMARSAHASHRAPVAHDCAQASHPTPGASRAPGARRASKSPVTRRRARSAHASHPVHGAVCTCKSPGTRRPRPCTRKSPDTRRPACKQVTRHPSPGTGRPSARTQHTARARQSPGTLDAHARAGLPHMQATRCPPSQPAHCHPSPGDGHPAPVTRRPSPGTRHPAMGTRRTVTRRRAPDARRQGTDAQSPNAVCRPSHPAPCTRRPAHCHPVAPNGRQPSACTAWSTCILRTGFVLALTHCMHVSSPDACIAGHPTPARQVTRRMHGKSPLKIAQVQNRLVNAEDMGFRLTYPEYLCFSHGVGLGQFGRRHSRASCVRVGSD